MSKNLNDIVREAEHQYKTDEVFRKMVDSNAKAMADEAARACYEEVTKKNPNPLPS